MSIGVINMLAVYAACLVTMCIQIRHPQYKWVKLPRKVRGITAVDPIIFVILIAFAVSTFVQLVVFGAVR